MTTPAGRCPSASDRRAPQSKTAALMMGDILNVPLDSADDSGWVKVNAGQTGFYRVNYSTEQWQRLGEAVGSMELPATDRLGLQNDAYALMRAGSLSPATFLALAENYRERDPRFRVERPGLQLGFLRQPHWQPALLRPVPALRPGYF